MNSDANGISSDPSWCHMEQSNWPVGPCLNRPTWDTIQRLKLLSSGRIGDTAADGWSKLRAHPHLCHHCYFAEGLQDWHLLTLTLRKSHFENVTLSSQLSVFINLHRLFHTWCKWTRFNLVITLPNTIVCRALCQVWYTCLRQESSPNLWAASSRISS